jgi:two-component system, OmpR family, response regulator QseB
MRVLVIEDDPQIGDAIATGLQQAGFTIDWVKTANDAVAATLSHAYSVMIVDLGLPDRSGLELLRDFRQIGMDTAILILTARDGLQDRVQGLDAGADDYVVKPFDLEELCARVRALGRRVVGRPQPVIEHHGLRLDPATRSVTRDGNEIELSRREFDVLIHLLELKGQVVSRSRLEEQLYAWGEEVASNSVEVHIHHLRRKLGSELIRTIRGVGYIVEAGA